MLQTAANIAERCCSTRPFLVHCRSINAGKRAKAWLLHLISMQTFAAH